MPHSKMLMAAAVGAVVLTSPAQGIQSYVARLPNGNNVYVNGVKINAIGHEDPNGGGARNSFGMGWTSAGWTTTYCQADSDEDGQSNGLELGDPNCTWTQGATPGRTVLISHPGDASSTTTATASTTDANAVTPSPSSGSGAYSGLWQAGALLCASLQVLQLVLA